MLATLKKKKRELLPPNLRSRTTRLRGSAALLAVCAGRARPCNHTMSSRGASPTSAMAGAASGAPPAPVHGNPATDEEAVVVINWRERIERDLGDGVFPSMLHSDAPPTCRWVVFVGRGEQKILRACRRRAAHGSTECVRHGSGSRVAHNPCSICRDHFGHDGVIHEGHPSHFGYIGMADDAPAWRRTYGFLNDKLPEILRRSHVLAATRDGKRKFHDDTTTAAAAAVASFGGGGNGAGGNGNGNGGGNGAGNGGGNGGGDDDDDDDDEGGGSGSDAPVRDPPPSPFKRARRIPWAQQRRKLGYGGGQAAIDKVPMGRRAALFGLFLYLELTDYQNLLVRRKITREGKENLTEKELLVMQGPTYGSGNVWSNDLYLRAAAIGHIDAAAVKPCWDAWRRKHLAENGEVAERFHKYPAFQL